MATRWIKPFQSVHKTQVVEYEYHVHVCISLHINDECILMFYFALPVIIIGLEITIYSQEFYPWIKYMEHVENLVKVSVNLMKGSLTRKKYMEYVENLVKVLGSSTRKRKIKICLFIQCLRKTNWVLSEGWIIITKEKTLLTKCR